jgi:hypothetical protein
VMSMRLCCCDLVGVDSKTLDPFIFINFVYVLFSQKPLNLELS